MEKMNFSIHINAPKEKVWEVLWNDATYRKWTSIFSESSHAETDWKEGSKILFLDGKGSGMVSRIETKIHNELMTFKHLGEVKDGVEDTSGENVSPWAGAMESYRLKDLDGSTLLEVDVDISDHFKDYMSKTFPKAIKLVKELSEKQ